jgi:hypothetical protein
VIPGRRNRWRHILGAGNTRVAPTVRRDPGRCRPWPSYGRARAAAGLIAASPAYTASATASVQDSGAPQYHLSCNSQSTCNTHTTGTLEIQSTVPVALGIFYQITNGAAVDDTDFNVPAIGEVIIPAGQFNQDLAVPLVNEGLFRSAATKVFTIAITGTSPSVTSTQRNATATINRRQHTAGLLVHLDQQLQPVAFLQSAACDSGVELHGRALHRAEVLPPEHGGRRGVVGVVPLGRRLRAGGVTRAAAVTTRGSS